MNSQPVRKTRWPQLYFALAGFDLVTVTISLAVTHYLVGQHLTTTQDHFEWANRLERYADLAETATQLNVAGNQVFETDDPDDARESVEHSAREFEQTLASIRAELRDRVSPEHRDRVLQGFDRADEAMTDQIREAREIVRLFMDGERQEAGAHMVQMDRHHAQLVLALTQVSREVAAIESTALAGQAETAQLLRQFEYVIAALIALMVVGVAVYGTRLTRLMQATAQREAAASRMLADQMAQIAQVATGMAHEIRNPLTSIKLLVQENRAELAEHGVPDTDLEIVESEVDRMERKLNTFLQFARPSPPQFHTIDLIECVRQTLALVRLQADSQNVTCETQFDSETVRVACDVDQIQQVLLNLILNSLDAMPHGGTLTASVSNAAEGRNPKVAWAPGPCRTAHTGRGAHATKMRATDAHDSMKDSNKVDLVTVTVTDTGSGIPDSVQDRLFEAFVTSKSAGIGLGLVVCRQIIEHHNGTLTGTNRPDGGAVFSFTLPGGAGFRTEGNKGNEGQADK